MRMRTVREAHREIKATDPNSGLTLSALYNLVAQGIIPAVKVGERRYLIDLDKLGDYLDGGTEVRC